MMRRPQVEIDMDLIKGNIHVLHGSIAKLRDDIEKLEKNINVLYTSMIVLILLFGFWIIAGYIM